MRGKTMAYGILDSITFETHKDKFNTYQGAVLATGNLPQDSNPQIVALNSSCTLNCCHCTKRAEMCEVLY